MEPTTINLTTPSSTTNDILTLVALVTLAVTLIVHLMIALGVMNDSAVMQRRGMRLMFFGPLGWTFLALMTGLFGLVAYWLMHHSLFRTSPPVESASEGKSNAGHLG